MTSNLPQKTKPPTKPKKQIYHTCIEKFMKTKRTLPWSIALSDRQMLAADNLLMSIRDDIHQGTTHRVRFILETIGIFPVVTPKLIGFAMKLSDGNDLAFLWFLMELYYNDVVEAHSHDVMTTPQTAYTINQQLIMSTIAHLDMITTLRELDKILPRQGKKCNKKKFNAPVTPQKRARKPKEYLSVYLQPLVKPIHIPAKRCPPPLDGPVEIVPYEKYLDPQYIVVNESNRWYAHPDYKTGLDGRISSINIVRGILTDEIKRILTCNPENNRSKNVITLCNKHKEMEKMQKSLMNKLEVAAHEKCVKYFSDEGKTEYLRKRFQAQLEKDLQRTKEEFDTLSHRYQTQTWLRLILHELVDKNINLKNVKLCDQVDSCSMDASILKGILQQEKYYEANQPGTCESIHKCCLDFGNHGRPKRNETFFHAAKKHAPYKFDYPRIFDVNDLVSPRDPEKRIRNSLGAALDIEKYLDEDEAIAGSLKKIWNHEVKLWNEKYKTMDENDDNLASGQNPQHIVPCPNDLLKRQSAKKPTLLCSNNRYYDPRDDHLIESLLKEALNEMKKNPKFVLASLPEVFKLDILKQWLKRRYGLIYTQEERNKALKKTRIILHYMRQALSSVRLPRKIDIGINEYVPYRCRKYVFQRTENVVQSFYRKMKNRMLADVKIYWQALEPFHCKAGPPREVFYAYMPSKESEILPFRPWECRNFRDMKKASDARIRLRSTCFKRS